MATSRQLPAQPPLRPPPGTESGRVDEALPLAEAAATRGDSLRLLVGQSYWIALLGEACAHGGRADEAARLLE
jgi:hypothetical protein